MPPGLSPMICTSLVSKQGFYGDSSSERSRVLWHSCRAQSWAATLYRADAQSLSMTEGLRIVAAPKHSRRGMKVMMPVLRTRHTLSAGAALGADSVSRTLRLVPFWSTPDRVAVGLLSLHTMLISTHALPSTPRCWGHYVCVSLPRLCPARGILAIAAPILECKHTAPVHKEQGVSNRCISARQS